MNAPIFCCGNIQPQKVTRTVDDPKFSAFRNAAMHNDVRFLCRPSSSRNNPITPTTSHSSSASRSSNHKGSHSSGSNPSWDSKSPLDDSSRIAELGAQSEEDYDDDEEQEDYIDDSRYIIQVIKRADVGTIMWVRYFANSRGDLGGRQGGWMEVDGKKIGDMEKEGRCSWVRGASFKNCTCKYHYRLFEVNLIERGG
jgi:hypothetical protein